MERRSISFISAPPTPGSQRSGAATTPQALGDSTQGDGAKHGFDLRNGRRLVAFAQEGAVEAVGGVLAGLVAIGRVEIEKAAGFPRERAAQALDELLAVQSRHVKVDDREIGVF